MNKTIKILLSAAVLLTLAFGVWSLIDSQKNNKDIITEKDPNVTPETRSVYEQRLSDARNKVNEISEDTSSEDKFNRYVALGNAQSSLGQLAKAKDAYDSALEIKPDDPYLWHIYSSLLTQMQDYDRAMGAIKKAISLNSGESDFWKWQIDLERDHFNSDQNRINDLFVEALVKTNDNINIITTYATFKEEAGDLQVAKEYWQKASEINPSGRAIYEAEIKRIDDKIKAQSK